MRLGTKILLLMLAITIGSSLIVAWIVTFNLTSHETRRANEEISLAIKRYLTRVDERHEQVNKIVRALMEAPVQRSQLQAADESNDPAAREQLRQEVLGRNVQIELTSSEGAPAFHVLVNAAGEVLVATASAGKEQEQLLASNSLKWPVDAVLTPQPGKLVRQYVWTPQGLYLAMAVPLRTQLNEAPTHAYFVGFKVDDDWTRKQLIADRVAGEESAQVGLIGVFVVDDKQTARASSDSGDKREMQIPRTSEMQHRPAEGLFIGAMAEPVEFVAGGEHFLGQSFALQPAGAKSGQLILASSLDQALASLHRLQRDILFTAAGAGLLGIVVCRRLARSISKPIEDLAAGTQRVADGSFDTPVEVYRRDELGKLASSFNQMAQGLKERDRLRDERLKIERDLAVARKIQMDILPKTLPTCPGYSLAACSFPAEATGGDIYDVVAVALEEDKKEQKNGDLTPLVLLLADATGHGVGPAISVTQVRAMLRIGVRLRAGLDEVFSQINRQLCQDLDSERFVTAFLGLLDPSAHRVNYQSAGQGPLIHFHARDKSMQWLDSSMVPLGLFEDAEDDGVQSMEIAEGDLVVLLTDGFFEYHNAANEQFGCDRVAEIILKHHNRSARDVLNEMLSAVRDFAGQAPQMDDMTALIIKRLSPGEKG